MTKPLPQPTPPSERSRRGGIARAKKLSKARRKAIAKAAAAARWGKKS